MINNLLKTVVILYINLYVLNTNNLYRAQQEQQHPLIINNIMNNDQQNMSISNLDNDHCLKLEYSALKKYTIKSNIYSDMDISSNDVKLLVLNSRLLYDQYLKANIDDEDEKDSYVRMQAVMYIDLKQNILL